MKVILFSLAFLIPTTWAATPITYAETSIQGGANKDSRQTDETGSTDGRTIIIETDEAGRPAIELEAAQPKKQKGPTRGKTPERSSSEAMNPNNAPQMGVQLKMPFSKPKKTTPTQPKE